MHSSAVTSIRARVALPCLSMLSAVLIGLAPTAAQAAYQASAMMDWRTFNASTSEGAVTWLPGGFQSYVQVAQPEQAQSAGDWASEMRVSLGSGDDKASARILSALGGGDLLEVQASALTSFDGVQASAHRLGRFTLAPGASIVFSIQSAFSITDDSPRSQALALLEIRENDSGQIVANGLDHPTAPGTQSFVTQVSYTNLDNTAKLYILDAGAYVYATAAPAVPEPASLAMVLGGIMVTGAVTQRRRRHQN